MSTTEIKNDPEYQLREAQEEAGLRPAQSDAVKEATTLVEHGFPVNTPDGQIMATKKAVRVDAKGNEIPASQHPVVVETNTVIEAEDGTVLEISDDPHVLQAEGTAEKQAAAAAKADEPKARSKPEN